MYNAGYYKRIGAIIPSRAVDFSHCQCKRDEREVNESQIQQTFCIRISLLAVPTNNNGK